MGLSPDINPGKRASSVPEARSFFLSSGSVYVKDQFLLAAFNMGEFSGVYVTQQEASLYRDLRKRLPDGKEPLKSDQVLMAEDVLSGEKRTKFKQAFPNIFPSI